MNMKKTIKLKKSGVITEVSPEYFDRYVSEGFFIEVYKEPETIFIEPIAKPKTTKAAPKKEE
jgi:hypothetical protein